jgi:rhomboid protease GluP
MDDATEKTLRVTGDRRQADDWVLVLASAAIPARLERADAAWVLVVPAGDVVRAARAIDAYERENPPPGPAPPEPPEYGPTFAGLAAAGLLFIFYGITAPGSIPSPWLEAGGASARRILSGDVWRAVTALTLHADFGHVTGNAVALAIFGTAVCRALGPGVGLFLILLSGAGGNLLDALLRGPGYIGIGASTAVFGACGVLGAMQMTRLRRGRVAGWRAWAPIAAALGLLAFLGASPEADVIAHLFGFFVGALLGGAAGVGLRRPPGAPVQKALLFTTGLVVAGSWFLALS